jgi:hypothetical protein
MYKYYDPYYEFLLESGVSWAVWEATMMRQPAMPTKHFLPTILVVLFEQLHAYSNILTNGSRKPKKKLPCALPPMNSVRRCALFLA